MAEHMDKDEFGWTKIKRERQGGKTRFGKDYYVVSPLGKRSRSFRDLTIHIRENNLYDKINPRIINLEKVDDDANDNTVERLPKSNNGKEFLMFLESKGEYEPKFMIRKPKKLSVPSTENNQGEKRKKTSNNNNQVLAANKKKKKCTKNCEECDKCKRLMPKKDLSLEEDGKILSQLCLATAHLDTAGLTLTLNASQIGMKKCDQCHDFTKNDQLISMNDEIFRGRVLMLCQDCICPDPNTVLDTWFANRRICPLQHEAETLARKSRLPVNEVRKYIEELFYSALKYPTTTDPDDYADDLQEHEHVPVVKQEPDNVEEDNFEPLDAEFGSSTFDPLDVKEELFDHHHKDIINRKSAEHYPEKFMNRPGPAPKRNEPSKLYHEVYIKTESSDDEQYIVHDVPSNSEGDEIPNFDENFSDDDTELVEENSDNNVEIGNVTSIKEEPLDHQLAN